MEQRKGRRNTATSYYDHHIPTGLHLCLKTAIGFARAAFGTVTVVRLADLLGDDKADAGVFGAVTGQIQDKKRMRPRFAFASHPCKLLWSPQPLRAWQRHSLPMTALNLAALVADRQFPPPAFTPCFQHRPPIFGGHAMQKAVFAAARNPLWFPCLTHNVVRSNAPKGTIDKGKSGEWSPRSQNAIVLLYGFLRGGVK